MSNLNNYDFDGLTGLQVEEELNLTVDEVNRLNDAAVQKHDAGQAYTAGDVVHVGDVFYIAQTAAEKGSAITDYSVSPTANNGDWRPLADQKYDPNSENAPSGIAIDGVYKRKQIGTFASAVSGSHEQFDVVETMCHTSIIYGGGAKYNRDGTTGAPSTGNEYKFYDGSGDGFKISEQEIYVSMFGGQRDNQAFDSSAAVQSAISYGSPVVFDGMYSIATKIIIPNDVKTDLKGRSWDDGLIAVAAMTNMLEYTNAAVILGNTFQDFQLDANDLANTCIRFVRGKSWYFKNLQLRYFLDRGAHFGEPGAGGATWYEMRLIDCKIDGGIGQRRLDNSAPYGLYMDDGATDNLITGIIVSYVMTTAIHVESGANRFLGGHIYGGTQTGFWYDGVVSVFGMYFDTLAGHCIFADAAGGSFTGCYFDNNSGSEFYQTGVYGFGSSANFPVNIIGGYSANLESIVNPAAELGVTSNIQIEQNNTVNLDTAFRTSDLKITAIQENVDRKLIVNAAVRQAAKIELEESGSLVYKIERTAWGGDVEHSAEGRDINFLTPVKLQSVGFYGSPPLVSKPQVTGASGTAAAIASLTTALNTLGLIDDQTT